MNKSNFFKKTVNWLILFSIIFLIGYIGYRIYNAAVDNLTQRIRQEVSKEIVDTVNPFKWVGKIFGHKRKKEEN